MAGCEKCQRKFLTTAVYSRDAVGAQDYLFSKLDRHDGEEKPKEASLGVVRLVTIAKPDCWVFFLAHLGACPPKHLSRILPRNGHARLPPATSQALARDSRRPSPRAKYGTNACAAEGTESRI